MATNAEEVSPFVAEDLPRNNPSLTSGRVLARNTVWNLVGTIAPLLVAVPAVPLLIRAMGTDRFGVLTLAWVVIGYFSLFDLGFGRALTKLVAQKLGANQSGEIPGLFWTSLLLMTLFSGIGTLLMVFLSPLMVHSLLHVPVTIQTETLQAFYVLAVSLPVVITTAALRGFLEAHQRFGLLNAVRVPMGVFTFVGPLLVLPFSTSLSVIVSVLAAGRFLAWAVHVLLCLKVEPKLRKGVVWQGAAVKPLLHFGGWVTIGNIVNPVLLFLDRFLIGVMLPIAMVGFYTAPFEAVTKLWVIPTSLAATVFPACSAIGVGRTQELERLYARSVRYLFCAVAPVSVALILFARPIIGVWLGQEFAEKSSITLQFLAAGVFINCFAHVPYCFLQGLGRPDLPAKLFLAELLPYGLLLWWMITRYGIAGAAAAWTIRVTIEVALLLWLGQRTFSLSARNLLDRRMWIGLAVLGGSVIGIYTTDLLAKGNLFLKAVICVFWLGGFTLVAWKRVLDDADRSAVLSALRPLKNSIGKSVEWVEAD